MGLGKLLTKINSSIRPSHVKGDRQAEERLKDYRDEAMVVGMQGTPTNLLPSQQDEKPRY
jgi:hypothetical protein